MDKKTMVLKVEIGTLESSINEELMRDIDETFYEIYWQSLKRGGHYISHINPLQWEYKKVVDLCKDERFSRQHFNTIKDWYHIISVLKNINYAKKK